MTLISKQRLLYRKLSLLRQTRLDAGLNQEDVAERLRRPQSFISKYESGERRLDVIEYIEVCAAIGISPHGIICRLTGIKK